MRKSLRRIRGTLGMGFIWAAALFAVGTVPRWVFGVETDAPIPLVFGVFGFIAGVTFGALLVLTEGRRRFDQLSMRRFAGWGALGGLLLSALWANAVSLPWGEVLAIAPTFAVACAVCATGSLAVARRAARRDLSDTRGDAAEAELTDHEKRQLPGGDD
jgi:peptidoglycan/LPS O-acetylase OafA/YrhL